MSLFLKRDFYKMISGNNKNILNLTINRKNIYSISLEETEKMKKQVISIITASTIALSAGLSSYPAMNASASTKIQSVSGTFKATTAKTLYKSANKTKIGTVPRKTVVKVSSKTKINGKTWYKVSYGSKTGWVKSVNLSRIIVSSAKKIAKTYKSTTRKTMYAGAGTHQKKMGIISRGAVLSAKYSRTVNGKTWYKVKTSTGKYGWTSAVNVKKYVKPVSNNGDKLIKEGAKHLGTPYVWGGTTTNGFDCSGFVRYVYQKTLGKSLPRTSGEQYNKAKKISKSQLEKGDLVFFSASGGRITHVAMYAGNGKLLHAAGNKVQYQNLAGYWSNLVVGYGTYQ